MGTCTEKLLVFVRGFEICERTDRQTRWSRRERSNHKVTLHRARLVLRWATVSRYTVLPILVCNPPSSPTQPPALSGAGYEHRPSGEWQCSLVGNTYTGNASRTAVYPLILWSKKWRVWHPIPIQYSEVRVKVVRLVNRKGVRPNVLHKISNYEFRNRSATLSLLPPTDVVRP